MGRKVMQNIPTCFENLNVVTNDARGGLRS